MMRSHLPSSMPMLQAFFLSLLLSGTSPAQQLYRETHNAMGTVWTLDLYAPDENNAAHVAAEAFETVDRIDDELSNYKPSSELTRIGHEAGSGNVTTDPETFAFLERSLHWSRVSNGAFDITVGPLLRAWGFFFHNGRIPSDAELQSLRTQVGWQNVELDRDTRSVHFRNGRPLDLDPGSIGKGFAVDRAVERLRAEGVTSALLSAGGSTLYAIGSPPGKLGWPVVVNDPRSAGTVASTVLLKDESLSTGACTEKFFIRDGHRYCHIFNPQTMRPVEGMLQTTVIDPSATDSDALSTVAFVLPREESRRLFANLGHTRLLLFTLAAQEPTCLAVHWQTDACIDSTTLRNPER